MAQIDKIHEHSFRRFFFDILRDENSSRYTLTKFASLVGLILLSATVVMSLVVMWINREIDHVLIVELIGFVLTLLGFKNSFGFKGKDGQTINSSGNTDNNSAITGEDTKGRMGDGQREESMKCAAVNPKEQADFVDDSIKG